MAPYCFEEVLGGAMSLVVAYGDLIAPRDSGRLSQEKPYRGSERQCSRQTKSNPKVIHTRVDFLSGILHISRDVRIVTH